MPRNVYFSHGTRNEQNLLEDLIIESISIYGQDFYYIPRTYVAKDEILGEDRLSKFEHAYPIEMYLESVDGFEGQGAFIQKFGLMMEQSATLTVSRRRWEKLIGKYDDEELPLRPREGDLLYFPLTNGLFEIKFVDHQDPFYQLGKLYVYKLQVELFQYASERLDTGVQQIDVFESIKSFSVDTNQSETGRVSSITIVNQGSGYTLPPTVEIEGDGYGATATAILGTGTKAGRVISIVVNEGGESYNTVPTVTLSQPQSPTGVRATATAQISIDIDRPDSFGDNSSFDKESSTIVITKSGLN